MTMQNTKAQRFDRHGNLIEDDGDILQDGQSCRVGLSIMDVKTAPQQIVRDEIQDAQDRAAARYDQHCSDMENAWRDKPQAAATVADSGDAYADYCNRLNNAWRA